MLATACAAGQCCSRSSRVAALPLTQNELEKGQLRDQSRAFNGYCDTGVKILLCCPGTERMRS